MGLLLLLGTIIGALVGVTSAIFGIVTVIAAFTTLKDWGTRFTVLYALLGWFVIGMWIASYIG